VVRACAPTPWKLAKSAESIGLSPQRRVSAVTVTSDALFAALGTLGLRHRMPTIFTFREFVAAGGLTGYSRSLTDTTHISGAYADPILKGEEPADLPVQHSTKVQMVINVKDRASARDHGATIGVGAR
jgi:ABC-type uncharacterized transport system substrate-binding protein